MKHWTDNLNELRTKATAARATMLEETRKLDYVRDLSACDWTFSRKSNVARGDSYAIQCKDGWLFVRLVQKETWLVRVANDNPALPLILAYRETYSESRIGREVRHKTFMEQLDNLS